MKDLVAPCETVRGESGLPRVSVIMPCRNERDHIAASVASVLAFDYPADRLDLTVMDGMSDDSTRALLDELAAREDRLKVLDNPGRLPAPGLNHAIEVAKGDIILRVDAHTIYASDYARLCVQALLETGADNVGGVLETIPGAETAMAHAIACGVSHPFGVGNSVFRIGVAARRWTDTVPFGCWRAETLRSLGGFATDLPYAEDDELNARLVRRGGRILLDPAIRARYIARPTLGKLGIMMYRYGRYKPASSRRVGRIVTWRQLVPPLFVATPAISAVAGFAWPMLWLAPVALLTAHASAGMIIAIRSRTRIGWTSAMQLPVVFLTMHVTYGLGYLVGLPALLFERRSVSSGKRP